MITLGIETSGQRGSVALLRDEQLLGERDLSREGRRHARTLLAELRELLGEAQVPPDGVDTIAVSIGPGSFTGLRVGVTCAKTWAYATGAGVIGVDTYLAVAERSATTRSSLEVIGDAQRGDLFVGRFVRGTDRSWQREGEIRIVNVDSWIESRSADTPVSGTAINQLRTRIDESAELEPDDSCDPRAEEVARIGERLASSGATDDLWTLEPLYLRQSAAEEKAERASGST